MKRLVGLLVLFSMMTLPSIAFAGEKNGVYVAPKFVFSYNKIKGTKLNGLSNNQSFGDDSDLTVGGAFAVGYDFGKKYNIPLRTEFEYTLSSIAGESEDSIGYGIQTLFLNTYWDIHTKTKLTPYVGAGVGFAFLNTKLNLGWESKSKTETNFAWNVGAGIGYDINESWTMDLGYRFVSLGSMKTASVRTNSGDIFVKTDNTYQHQVNLGLRYTF